MFHCQSVEISDGGMAVNMFFECLSTAYANMRVSNSRLGQLVTKAYSPSEAPQTAPPRRGKPTRVYSVPGMACKPHQPCLS